MIALPENFSQVVQGIVDLMRKENRSSFEASDGRHFYRVALCGDCAQVNITQERKVIPFESHD